MADFSAILTKTLEKIGETTPEVRAQVYDKARATVQRQIDAMATRPPQAAIDRQFAKLNEAIADMEARFLPAPLPEPEPDVDIGGFDEFMAGEELGVDEATDASVPALVDDIPAREPEPARDPLLDFLNEQQDKAASEKASAAEVASQSVGAATVAASGIVANDLGRRADDDLDDTFATFKPERPEPLQERRPRERSERKPPLEGERASPPMAGRIALVAVLVALVAGAAFGGWQYQDRIMALFNADPQPVVVTNDGEAPVRTVETRAVTEPATPGRQVAEAPPPPPETIDATGNGDGTTKFTQRLTENGQEIDEGPVGGGAATGEGSSVAGQTKPGTDPAPDGTTAPAAPGATAQGAEPSAPLPATEATNAPIPVGQRAIFYEERTGSAAGTALAGATVWSVVQESSGTDMPPEPAIRADVSVPELGMTMTMTIKRNGDLTLPASHIVELFFNVPPTFEGRGIADVSRITFKATEQDPGSALVAVPAPIDTNIFLIALTDAQTAIDTNIQLMAAQTWLDIPMQYVSGRRAQITLEKGLPGDAVFKDVFAAWEANPLPRS